MELVEAINNLNDKLSQFDWYSKKIEKNPRLHNSIVVYTNKLNAEVYECVPSKIGQWDVRVHFFTNNFKPSQVEFNSKSKVIEQVVQEKTNEIDVQAEIWILAKECGWDDLEDILYEIQDGINAVTDKSKEFPNVRVCLEKLYNLFGYDVIAEHVI
jgi:hypothetical protein